MNTTTIALILFLLGALGGLAMALRSLKDQEIPWVLTAGHGVLVASGLVILLLVVLDGGGGGLAKIALGVLAVAALGGFYLVRFHLKGSSHPRSGLVIHALAGVIGVGFLIGSLLSS